MLLCYNHFPPPVLPPPPYILCLYSYSIIKLRKYNKMLYLSIIKILIII